MLDYPFRNENDALLASSTFSRVANLLFGKRNVGLINQFKNIFNAYVTHLEILPQGEESDILTGDIAGACYLFKREAHPELEDQAIGITIRGLEGATDDRADVIVHECTHEFVHACTELATRIRAKYRNGVDRNNTHVCNSFGTIEETRVVDGETVKEEYGIMFQETMTDMIASMALVTFPPKDDVNIDDILTDSHIDIGNSTSAYDFFTSISRLMIAAFSLDATISYDELAKSGTGIFDTRTVLADGSSVFTNDFLYGIVFDPMHIEQVYDEVMGAGQYKKLCKSFDALFDHYKSTPYSNREQILRDIGPQVKQSIMEVLPQFVNRRLYMLRDKTTQSQRDQIASNFNRIWNEMQRQYGAYFSQSEINQMIQDGTQILNGNDTRRSRRNY